MQLAIISQLPHLGRQSRLVAFQPAQTPADHPGNQQQRQARKEGDGDSGPRFFPVDGDLHILDFITQRLRERFEPLPVHRLVAVHPENLLRQDLLQIFGHAHQLLLIDLQVNRHHQLITQLLIQLIEQFPTHIHHLHQRIVDFIVHLALMPLFQFGDKRIALEQGIALLVYLKLLKTQIRDAVGHIFQLICRRQRLLLLIQNTRQQQAAFQHRDLFFYIALGLQRAIEPVFHPDVLLHQRVAILGGGDQLLA